MLRKTALRESSCKAVLFCNFVLALDNKMQNNL